MNRSVPTFNVVIERDEEGWLVASVPELPGCHTQAKTQDDLLARIKEAIQLHIKEHGGPEKSAEFIGVQRVEVPADSSKRVRISRAEMRKRVRDLPTMSVGPLGDLDKILDDALMEEHGKHFRARPR